MALMIAQPKPPVVAEAWLSHQAFKAMFNSAPAPAIWFKTRISPRAVSRVLNTYPWAKMAKAIMSQEGSHAVLLAAGLSTRLGQPKALVNIAGRPAILWIYEHLQAGGCTQIVVVVNEHIRSSVSEILPSAVLSVDP